MADDWQKNADRECLLAHGAELASGELEDTAAYLHHCGITTKDLEAAEGDIALAFLKHYETADGYDIDRAGKDMGTYPPVLARIKQMDWPAVAQHRTDLH